MKGVKRDKGGVLWLDTRAQDWEPMPGMPGFFRKVLWLDEDGVPLVMLNYLPPGRPLAPPPFRHYHSTATEFGLVLEGEFPGWEYASAEQTKGDLMWRKRGYFMQRAPGSIHGQEEGAVSPTGAILLTWREGGPGVWIGEPGYEKESVHVPYGDGNVESEPGPNEGGAVLRDRGGVRWVDTRAMDWEPMPDTPGVLMKPLCRDDEGEPTVAIVSIPAVSGLRRNRERFRHIHKTITEFLYVLDGEYVGHEYETAAQQKGDEMWKKKGYFMARRPRSIHGSEAGPVSLTGAIIVNWRDRGSGIWVFERDYATESETIPFDS